MVNLIIGTKNYAGNILADGSYDVSKEPEGVSWKDGNNVERFRKTRDVINGSFTMFFKTMSAYESFLEDLAAVKDTTEDTVPATVTINYPTNSDAEGNFRISFRPVRTRRGDWTDAMLKFTVTIKEA